MQTPSVTRLRPVVAIPPTSVQGRERDAHRSSPRQWHPEAQGAGRWMVLGITAGCKVGTFHLGGAGSSHCHRGPGPQGNEAGDPCPGQCPDSPTRTSIWPHRAPGEPILALRTIDSLGPPADAQRQVLAVASDK